MTIMCSIYSGIYYDIKWIAYFFQCKATMFFFLCFRWARALDLGRALPKKHVFFQPRARIRLLPISGKKQSISRGKKKLPKKTNSFREIKNISSYVFFACFFFVALINFFLKGQKLFFILSPSLTFFFLKCFFPPSVIRFLIFSDL